MEWRIGIHYYFLNLIMYIISKRLEIILYINLFVMSFYWNYESKTNAIHVWNPYHIFDISIKEIVFMKVSICSFMFRNIHVFVTFTKKDVILNRLPNFHLDTCIPLMNILWLWWNSTYISYFILIYVSWSVGLSKFRKA